MRKILKIIGKIVVYLILFLFVLIGFSAEWYVKHFEGNTMNDILFTLKAPIGGADTSLIVSYLKEALGVSFLVFLGMLLLFILMPKCHLQINNKKIRLFPQAFIMLIVSFELIANISLAANEIQLGQYISYKMNTSTIYEENYVDPSKVKLTFPEQKRNLIYIYMESMETTYLSKEMGGVMDVNLIPELTELAENNISFSENDMYVGAQMVPGTSFTAGSLVAQTSGVPLNLPVNGNAYTGYGQFLPGTYTLGDILEEQGYHQAFLLGSDADFGGRKDYFTYHGDYEIDDYYWAIDQEKIPEDYYVWWGYEDEKLYDFAKEKVLELAQEDAPFNLSMLTVDTHHISGFYCDLCEDKYEEQYANVIACASRQAADFISWIQEQDFYENTTIIICGDHTSMDPNFFENINGTYRRATYNAFINSAVDTSYNKDRIFSAMDMYPSTLAAMGVQIEGEQLGIGVNLFSGKETILERLGTKYVFEEIQKNSRYYNEVLLYNK